MNKNLKKIFPILTFILFLINTYLVITNKTLVFDTLILKFIIGIRTDFFNIFFKFITIFANPNISFLICVTLFIIIKNKQNAVLICFNALFNAFLNQMLKHIIMRQRPNILPLIVQYGYSYPSGHTMFGISCFFACFLLLLKSNLNKKAKTVLLTILISLTILVPFSRIYIGVHYPTDIIGGFLLSITFTLIISKYFNIKTH